MYRQWLSTFPDPEQRRRTIIGKIPLGKRMTIPEEIAAMVLFLLSPRTGHMTGQHIFVDGGYVHLDRALNLTAMPLAEKISCPTPPAQIKRGVI